MISLLVTILIYALAFGVAAWALRLLPIPQPWANIALAIMGVIFLLTIINLAHLRLG